MNIYNNHNHNKNIVEYIIYKITFLMIIIMSFYIYIKKFIPIIPYFKDALILIILPLLFLFLIASSLRISRPNFLDIIILVLLIYLFAQFFRTGYQLSYAASYSGFRLTFIYILLYFLYRSISNEVFIKKIDSIFFKILLIGIVITYLESLFIKTGIVSVETLGKVMVLNRYSFQEYNRVYGITGSIHITGVYNCIFFSILLFGQHLKNINNKYNSLFLEKIKSIKSKKLIFISFIAVIISQSRTAWTCMLIILLIFSISGHKFEFKRYVSIITIIIIGSVLPILYFGSDIYTTYFTFLFAYSGLVMDFLIPLFDSFWFGNGYHVSQTAVGVDVDSISNNIMIYTDFFFLDILSSLGMIGLFLYFLIFLIIPGYILISKKYDYEIKVIAAPIVVVGISFGHYNPLQNPCVSIFIWYLFAQLSNLLSHKKYLLVKKMDRIQNYI